jgi:transposase-like protein
MVKVQNASTKDDAPIQDVPAACADEATAVAFMERTRWGDTPACPCCGSLAVYQMTGRNGEREANFRWRCRDCKAMYSVRKGTVFEDSRIPLRHWCFAFWRAATSKKGVSALEIHRQTGLSYKSSLFMLHRIRFAMAPADHGPLTGIVEADETFIGGKPRNRRNRKEASASRYDNKTAVMAMVERGGQVRSLVVADVSARTLGAALRKHVHRSARLMTDEAPAYQGVGRRFRSHETVKHSAGEYARGDVTTNTVEGYFGLLKRGINGIYHAVSRKHLHRYVGEFAFRYNRRYNTDGERTVALIMATEGKRLRYAEQIGAASSR